MKQQLTAVEWLEKEVNQYGILTKGLVLNLLSQAKEMEKEQIIDAYNEGVISVDCRGGNPEKYYNQTFEQ